MTDEQIQELVFTFLDARGGYLAGASERELFLMVKQACAQERERLRVGVLNMRLRHPKKDDPYDTGWNDGMESLASALRTD